jgi:ribonuclease BN (tRNA processing enzyme)
VAAATGVTELILLGTAGGPTPKAHRAAPAQAVVVGDATYVVDAGNGVARQLALAGIRLPSLRTVAVTHHHSDHNADLGTLLHLAWCADLTRAVTVVGPPPTEAMLAAFWEYAAADVDIRMADEGRADPRGLVHAHDLEPESLNAPVYEDDRVRITAATVEHPPIPALAYRIDTDDTSVVVSGDTRPCAGLVELASGADTLVHEVMHVPSVERLVDESVGSRLREHLLDAHTDVRRVGAVAAEAGVRRLVLSHFVPGDDSVPDETWRALASVGFDGELVVGRDLMRLAPPA